MQNIGALAYLVPILILGFGAMQLWKLRKSVMKEYRERNGN